MTTWTRQPQEQEGTYKFGGHFICTTAVAEKLTTDEINNIYQDTLKAVEENGGLDYLQVFKDLKGQKLFFIASLNQEMIDSGEYDLNDIENHNCVLMFSHEY